MMPFEDYVALKAKLGKRALMLGVPFTLTGFMGASFACAMLLPDLSPTAPQEDIQPIM